MNKRILYDRYKPSIKDIILIIIRALLIDLVIVYAFYKNVWICLCAMPVCMYVSYKTYISSMITKRRQELELEFEELLSCISSLLSAGYSLENAVYEAKKELSLIYDKGSLIMHELFLMCYGMEMNKPVEVLFRDLAGRSGIDDIVSFAEMISISKRTGGDMIAIVRQTIDVIHSKYEVNNEIRTMIAAKKYENRIMNLMPIGMIVFMSVFSPGYLDALYNNVFGTGVMTICLLVYGGSWLIGSKIMNIDMYSESGTGGKKNATGKIKKRSINNDSLYRFLSQTGIKKVLARIETKHEILYGNEAELMFCNWLYNLRNKLILIIPICIVVIAYTCLTAKDSLLYVLMLVGVVMFGIPYMSVNDLNKKLKRRKEQLMLDYPDTINRFILLLGSGINMRGAWGRMCSDYLENKEKKGNIHYVYEEMLKTQNDMARGIPEAESYERFGRRIQLLPYMKFGAMLCQNLKKGNKRLIDQLRLMSMDALVQRRDTMKQLGEEASSKLLFPMMLQFMLILVIVMVPAIRTM